MREKIPAFNFIRATCALAIIAFHFACASNNLKIQPILNFSYNHRLTLGGEIVTVFFMISGFLLYYNHSKIQSLLSFYKKRWLSIFPTFYLAYFFGFILTPFLNNPYFSKADVYIKPKSYFIFTIFGMDGYFRQFFNYQTWHILGEWFLGALIILYILYPLLLKWINSNEFALYFSIAILFIMFFNFPVMKQDTFRDPISCIVSFIFGMFVAKHSIYKNKVVVPISLILFLLMNFLPIPLEGNLGLHFSGFCIFFILYGFGSILMKNKMLNHLFNFIAKYSYDVFLLQHLVIFQVLAYYNPARTIPTLLLLLITIIITLALSVCLHELSKFIVSITRSAVSSISSRQHSKI